MAYNRSGIVDTHSKADGTDALANWKRPTNEHTIGWRWPAALAVLPKPPSDIGPTLDGLPVCPECGAATLIKGRTDRQGNRYYWPQCSALPEDLQHGYSGLSKHALRAPMGRKAGQRYEPPASDPKPAPVAPAAKVEPVTGVTLPKPIPEGAHPAFEAAARLALAMTGGPRVLLFEGPTGSGKTHLAKQLAKWLGCARTVVVGVSMSTDRSDLTYHRNPVTGEIRLSEGLSALKAGGAAIYDEVDGCQPGELLALNDLTSAWEHDGQPLPADALVIMTANCTAGASRVYTGRFPMDAATRARVFSVFVSYDERVDFAQAGHDLAIVEEVTRIRQRVNNDIKLAGLYLGAVGSRLCHQAAVAKKAFGLDGREAVRKVFTMGYDAATAAAIIG